MANQKFLAKGAGALQEVQAVATAGTSGEEGLIPCLDAIGRFNENMMPLGVSAETIVCKAAAGGLAANDVVYFYLDTIVKVDKADASDNTKNAMGYVKDIVSGGADATVFLDGELPGTTLTPGAIYYLSETPGLVTTTAPTTSAAIVQSIGVAVSVTGIRFDPNKQPIILV